MTDLRQQLEEAWTSADEQSSEPQDVVATSESNETAPAEPVEVINAPNSYTKEAKDWFNTLPYENKKYLAEREKQFEQGLSRARNQYAWVDKAYNDRKDNLTRQGFNSAQEYYDTLIKIADDLENNPQATIAQLQSIYGVGGNNDNALQRQLLDLQQKVTQQQDYLRQQENNRVKGEYDVFINAKDENGNLKHAYFDDVKGEMINLLNKGLAKNFEDAYEQAIWRVESVRNKLIEEKTKSGLAKATATAQKAKTAAFEPTAKTEATPKKRSLREEIEHNMAIYGEE